MRVRCSPSALVSYQSNSCILMHTAWKTGCCCRSTYFSKQNNRSYGTLSLSARFPSCRYVVTQAVKKIALNSLQNKILSQIESDNDLNPSRFNLHSYGLNLHSVFAVHRHADPFKAVARDMRLLADSINNDLANADHPVLQQVGSYFFNVSGKRIRPSIISLVSYAFTAGCVNVTDSNAINLGTQQICSMNDLQRRLSEITELIHTASLLHDDVIDDAVTRRGIPTVNQAFGNKLAILGGDFLLARASVALAQLRNHDVTELMSRVIEHLVRGEVIQLKPDYNADANSLKDNLRLYLAKSYYKTASLIANSCKSVAILGGHNEVMQDIAFEYGRNVGLAFQIVDDILDVVGNAQTMGKAAGADLKAGVVTVPYLYAAEEIPELRPLLARRFREPGDVARAVELCVTRSDGVDRARRLAEQCADSAVAAVLHLSPSSYRSALISLAEVVLTRTK